MRFWSNTGALISGSFKMACHFWSSVIGDPSGLTPRIKRSRSSAVGDCQKAPDLCLTVGTSDTFIRELGTVKFVDVG